MRTWRMPSLINPLVSGVKEGRVTMKKTIAIIVGVIPVVSAIIAIFLMISHFDSTAIRTVINTTTFLGFLGFVFFFVGRKLAGGDKTVRILGILDLLATVSIVGFYIIAIFAFGL